MANTAPGLRHIDIRPDWLAQRREDILDPGRPIVDAHHHLYTRRGVPYLLDEFLADAASGHNIRASVYVQTRGTGYRTAGDPAFAPVGEVEFACAVAADSRRHGPDLPDVCAAIVGFADLTLGERVRPVLEAMIDAGGDNFRGIRDSLTWDIHGLLNGEGSDDRNGRIANPKFREGFACLAPLDLAFDAWIYHPQIDELAEFLTGFPDTRVALNHMGGVLHIGPYAGQRPTVFADWAAAIRRLARLPNVMVKLGGIGMNYGGFTFHEQPEPPSSQALCDAWCPYVETCIEAFGTKRCMFESNFPVDKGTCSYAVVWNAFKRLTANASEEEKADLFNVTARRFYRLAP